MGAEETAHTAYPLGKSQSGQSGANPANQLVETTTTSRTALMAVKGNCRRPWVSCVKFLASTSSAGSTWMATRSPVLTLAETLRRIPRYPPSFDMTVLPRSSDSKTFIWCTQPLRGPGEIRVPRRLFSPAVGPFGIIFERWVWPFVGLEG